jgi:hypothetical protein
MSLSVKMPGENVADLPVATGKNDTEMGSHACGLSGAEFICIEYRLLRQKAAENKPFTITAMEEALSYNKPSSLTAPYEVGCGFQGLAG